MPTEVKYPDSIVASTNLTGSVTDIDDDPYNPDTNYMTADDPTSATDIRVTFPTPSGSPVSDQAFRLCLRKTTGAVNPTIDVSLYQGGSLRELLTDDVEVTSLYEQLINVPWNASSLSGTLDGSDVEVRIAATPGEDTVIGVQPGFSASGTLDSSGTMPGTVDVNVPLHAPGVLLLLLVLCRNTDNDGTLASINTAGWTQAGGAGNMYGGAQNARIGFGWKIGNGSESVVNITTTGGTGTDRRLSRVYTLSAADGFSTPPIVDIGTATTGTGTTATCPTVVPGGTTQNKRAVALFGISVNSSNGIPSGESGGDWTKDIVESGATNGTIGIITSDQSDGSTISGGTFSISSGNWVGIGFTVCPGQVGTAINTVEIAAIDWSVTYLSSGAVSSGSDSAIRDTITRDASADAKVIMPGTIITDQQPAIPAAADNSAVSTGTQFWADKFGHIRYIRWYNGRSIGVRTHKVGLFTADGSLLSVVEFTAEIGPGWQITELPEPIEVDEGVQYVAAVFWPQGEYPVTDGGLATQIDNEDLHAYAGGGKKTAGADLTFPVD